jgi:predicted DNA-binding transcriptional regulator AlpA
MPLLVITPRPYATESSRGFTLRLSEDNGYNNPYYVLNLAGINARRGAGRFRMEQLVTILGAPPSALRCLSNYGPPESGADEYYLLGHLLGTGRQNVAVAAKMLNPSFCPHCVVEEGYLDAFWDLRHVVACPKHKCTLIESCPVCKQPLSWSRPGLLLCQCDANLANARTFPADKCVVDLMAIIKLKLHSLPLTPLESSSSFPLELLETISLKSLLAIIDKLAYQGTVFNKSRLAAKAGIKMAAEALSNWPIGFHHYLENLEEFSDEISSKSISLNIRFRKLHGSIFKHRPFGDEANFLYEEYIHFGLNQCKQCVVDSRFLNGTHDKKRFISLRELSNLTGFSQKTLTAWIDNGLLPIQTMRIGKVTRYIFDTDEISMPKRNVENRLRLRGAAKCLGIPVDVFRKLRDSGHFEVKHQVAFLNGVHEKDIEVFRERLLQFAPLIDSPRPTGGCISLSAILLKMKFGSADKKADFIRDYLDGAIKTCGRWGTSLEDIYFNKAAALEYAARTRLDTGNGCMSRAAAAMLLRCSQAAIRSLITTGHLSEIPVKKSLSFITNESLAAFSSTYVSLNGLAGDNKTTTKRLASVASKGKVPILTLQNAYRNSATYFIEKKYISKLYEECKRHPRNIDLYPGLKRQ